MQHLKREDYWMYFLVRPLACELLQTNLWGFFYFSCEIASYGAESNINITMPIPVVLFRVLKLFGDLYRSTLYPPQLPAIKPSCQSFYHSGVIASVTTAAEIFWWQLCGVLQYGVVLSECRTDDHFPSTTNWGNRKGCVFDSDFSTLDSCKN